MRISDWSSDVCSSDLLGPDEALIVEAEVPTQCGYASLILTNDIYGTTDWYNNQASLNNAQWRVAGDGILRVVVSAKDPGVPNWLDTSCSPSDRTSTSLNSSHLCASRMPSSD